MNAARPAPHTTPHASPIALLAALLAGLWLASAARAEGICPPNPWPAMEARDTAWVAETELGARQLRSETGVYHLEGEVAVASGDQRLWADRVEYHPAAGLLRAEGDLRIAVPGLRLGGARGQSKPASGKLRLEEADYRLRIEPPRLGQHSARGTAELARREADGRIVLADSSYTTCPQGDSTWRLNAERVTIDRASGVGSARHLTLEIADIPVLYAPWFSFPFGDQRKTGFLFPELGDSDATGASLRLPWYWNMAANADATLTPRLMARRGLALETEWRYLNRQGHWQFDLDGLDDEVTDTRRHYLRLRHSGRFQDAFDGRLSSLIDASAVSDEDYFDQLGDDPALSALSHLDRRAQLAYRGDRYRLTLRAQRYQTIDESLPAGSRPYERLPQLLLDGRWPLAEPAGGSLNLGLHSEYVRFDRKDSVIGERFDLRPRLDWALGGRAWFARPALTLWHSSYDLGGVTGDYPDDIQRNLPLFSFDSGLFFERELSGGGLQTLEPRLFYLYAPHEEQGDIPLFDSGTYDFSFASLFRENRFSGSDRVGDANQLSIAASSRFLDADSGAEWLSLGIGQIVYFDDRRVQLFGNAVDAASRSPLVGELRASLDEHWRIVASSEWDDRQRVTEQSTLRASYRGADQRLFNFSHRYDRSDEEQIDLSAAWPLRNDLRGFARWNYSLDGDRTLNSLLGLEYESCCWAFRLAARQYVTDSDEDSRSIYAQLILKGLAGVGRGAGAQLRHDILGYSDPFD